MERVRSVLCWIDYGEYVMAWNQIPSNRRNQYTVTRDADGEWQPVHYTGLEAIFGG